MTAALKIGELARRAHCPVQTIRYYEREGLLPAPERSQGNFRLYDRTRLDRLEFILRCRSLDMTLDEVRVLLRFRGAPDEICEEVNDLLDAQIGRVAARINELKQLEKQLRALRARCGPSRRVRDCGILSTLSQAADR